MPAGSGKADQEIVDIFQAIMRWTTAAGGNVPALSTDGESACLQMLAREFELVANLCIFDLDSATERSARLGAIPTIPDTLYLLKILRYNICKYGKIHAWSGKWWFAVEDLVAAGIARTCSTINPLPSSHDHLSRKVFYPANLVACQRRLESTAHGALSLQENADFQIGDDDMAKHGQHGAR
jgi:hypothetical protein